MVERILTELPPECQDEITPRGGDPAAERLIMLVEDILDGELQGQHPVQLRGGAKIEGEPAGCALYGCLIQPVLGIHGICFIGLLAAEIDIDLGLEALQLGQHAHRSE